MKNKKIKLLENIIFTVLMIIIVSLIVITAQARVMGREPSLLGHRIYIVETGSMLPEIKIDSMIIVREMGAEKINIGDIITYYGHSGENKITHRVVAIENNGEYFITRGDANNVDDPLPVTEENLIGKVIFHIPYIGLLFKFITNKVVLSIIISITIFSIIIPILGKNRKS